MNKTSKKIFRTEFEWRQLLSTFQASDESCEFFCRKRGIGYSTFKKWQQKLKEPANPPFYELQPVGTNIKPKSQWPIEIELGQGQRVRLNNDADPMLVAQLLRLRYQD